ncbi:MAG: hypothetical protein JXA30_17635 [Deltaproteobacteria bacterium]|nr:hypothetical protein [Deltaproteobacteria bacterium]
MDLVNRYGVTKTIRTLFFVPVTMVALISHVNAQSDRDGPNTLESDIEVESADQVVEQPQSDDGSSSQGALGKTDDFRSGLLLPSFLFSIQMGPFFSFGQWVGALAEIEFEFRLHDFGYLSLLSSFNGGYQISFERGDFLFSETLGYRHYIPSSQKNAWTILAGFAFGYLTTTKGESEREYDWMHFGFKAKGGYHFFTDERFSIGIGVGLTIAYQFSEFLDAQDFVVLIPDASIGFTF